ncbi:hypothetical protein SD71_09405 [Cohnella kolymensis]|uniref:Uncharacterized protein n=1 Tax=Cohnella kolymensis TaxID=1590652 RepID=A0ABR5A6X2_9BACL|nr:hypothetical protein [Cohnella kolymensis]KIL36162.1 hypothetical protein SD71_09405 [Cohnella kolymensis]
MLSYCFNEQVIQITESSDENDVQFLIKVLQKDPYVEKMQKVRRFFDDNRVYTDVLFYALADHTYKVIVRIDFYADFILELMKHRLLESVEWKSGQ